MSPTSESEWQRCTWRNIFGTWHRLWDYGQNLPEADVKTVEVSSPHDGRRIADEVIDWWPQVEIADRAKSLERDGVLAATWPNHKGTLHTAQMLVDAPHEEAVAAAWIAASLFDIRNDLPEGWRGERYRLVEEMESAILKQLRTWDLPIWSAQMRHALPEDLLAGGIGLALEPHNFREIVAICRLHVALVRSVWTIVRVVNRRSS